MRNPSQNRKVFFLIPAVIIIIGIIFCAAIPPRGLNLDVDFAGGTSFDIITTYTADTEAAIVGIFEDEADVTPTIRKTSDIASGTDTVMVTVKELDETTQEAIIARLEEELGITTDDINIDSVGETISRSLIRDSLKAILLAVVLMLIYIWIRFDLQSGVSAVIALCHDLLIMFSFYAIFRTPINTSFIAAMLTIVGYSINATIVVFDRVRENSKLMRKSTFAEIADRSTVQSFGRAINSSITTLFTIGMLYILGVSSIKEFALPIVVGLVAGTYSSLFIAGSFWAMWKDSALEARKNKKK